MKNKIFIIAGRSSSGKDYVINNVLEKENEIHPDCLKILPQITTRPMRKPIEINSDRYEFIDNNTFEERVEKGGILNPEKYHVKPDENGNTEWWYGINPVPLDNCSYIIASGTSHPLDFINCITDYYGNENVITFVIESTDKTIITRMMNRERCKEHQNYQEMCRRFLDDSQSFNNSFYTIMIANNHNYITVVDDRYKVDYIQSMINDIMFHDINRTEEALTRYRLNRKSYLITYDGGNTNLTS